MRQRYGNPIARAIAVIILGVAGLLSPVQPSTANQTQGLTFCVLVPHFKDEYWLSVGYGLEREADRQDVSLIILEAGGYQSRTQQISQLHSCRDRGVDAIILGAVTSDHPDLLSAIAEISPTVPVFSMVNELHAPELSGSIGVDWEEMGLVLGQYLAARNPVGETPKTAVLVSGPQGAGWIGPLEAGLRRGLEHSSLTLAAVLGADTGLRQQLERVEAALEHYPELDYLIGSAPATEAAIGVLEHRATSRRPNLVSTYISHAVKRGLMNGRILAAPFDDPIAQGEIAITTAVGHVSQQGAPFPGNPPIVLLTNDKTLPTLAKLSPSDYFPNID